MKIMVTGASGLLGQKVCARGVEAGHRMIPFDLQSGTVTAAGPTRPIDISDSRQVRERVKESRPDWIVNTAAYTAVDDSEGAASRVEAVNVEGPVHLLEALADGGGRLLALSTDYVFDGRAGPYHEQDPRQPLGRYGASKAAMEDRLLESGQRCLIVRTMVLYGAAPGVRTNFGLWVLERLRRREPTPVVTDQLGNPTLAADLARLLVAMIEQEGRGLYHAAGADRVSRHQFARRLARCFGLDEGLLEPVTTAQLGQRADRPLASGLRLDALRRDFQLEPLGLDESLARFRRETETVGGIG